MGAGRARPDNSVNKETSTYDPEDPVAASIGTEREDYYELLVWIDEGLEVPYLIPKADVPLEFRKYGLSVWLVPDEEKRVRFERRTTRVLQEVVYAAKHDGEFEELMKSFGLEK